MSSVRSTRMFGTTLTTLSFSGLWNSNAFRRLKKGELPKNANVVTGKWVRNWKTDDRGNVISQNLGW